MTTTTAPLLDDDTAEMIAIQAWAQGSASQAALWGTLHRDSRAVSIAVVHVVARQLVALGWTPPGAARGRSEEP